MDWNWSERIHFGGYSERHPKQRKTTQKPILRASGRPETVQNDINNCLERLGCLAPKSSKTIRLLTNCSMYLDLDPLSQIILKQTFWSLQTTPSEGFGIRGLSKRHLPQGVVFPGLSKRHPPRHLALLGMYIRRTSRPCLPSLSKRHPPKGLSQIFQGVQSEPN